MTRSGFLSTLLLTVATSSLAAVADDEVVPAPTAVVTEADAVAGTLDTVAADTTVTTTVAAAQETAAATTTTAYTITPCPTVGMSNANNCVATSSTTKVAAYSPPWTFTCEPDQAFQTLLKILKDNEESNLGIRVTLADPQQLVIKATAVRLAFVDEMEFVIRPEDNVVVMRSGERTKGAGDGSTNPTKSSNSDFGANKARLEKMRKKSGGVFGVMGDLGGGDSYGGASNGGGNGVLGQLKAFYGLQSGEGYQDVFDDATK